MRQSLGIVPLMLLDEALSHLDHDHQKLLFTHLHGLKCQYWLSGVEIARHINFTEDAIQVSLEE